METTQQVADIGCIPLRGFKLALLISASHFKTMLKNKYLAYHLTNASFEILIFLLFPSREKLGIEELNQKQPNETSVTLGTLCLHPSRLRPSMAFLALFLSLVAPGTVPFSNWHVDTPFYLQFHVADVPALSHSCPLLSSLFHPVLCFSLLALLTWNTEPHSPATPPSALTVEKQGMDFEVFILSRA